MRPLHRFVLAVLAAAVVAVGTGSDASAADALPDGDFTVVYKGTLSSDSGNGQMRVKLTCARGRCQSNWGHLPKSFPLGPDGRIRQVLKKRLQSVCGGVTIITITTLAANSRSIRITSRIPQVEQSCGNGSHTHLKQAFTFVGTSTAGPAVAGDEGPGETAADDAAPDAGASDRTTGGAGTTPNRREDSPTTSRLDSGSASAPSVLSALPAVSEAAPSGKQSLLMAALVVVLVLLIAFPTHLLNTAVDTGHESLAAWWRQRRGRSETTESAGPGVAGWVKAASTVLAASLISGFVDPQFGFNPGSARTLASIAVSLTVESVLVWLTVLWLVRRMAPTVGASFRVAPSTLVVVVAAVALTRLTGFEPAIVFGLVAGVAFGAATSAAAEGKTVLAGVGLALVLALAGWVAYSILDAGPGAGFVTVLASETFSALAIAGIASLPIALVPLRGLAGHALYAWSRPLWAVSYAVGLIGFFLVLMPMPFSWAGVDLSLATWVTLYLVYAGVAVSAWFWVVRPWRRDAIAPA